MHTAPTLGVVTTDRHLAIRGWNAWVAEATGVAEADVVGRTLLDFVAPERVEFYRDLLSEVIASGSARVLSPAFHRYLIKCAPRSHSAHFDYMQQRTTIAPLMSESRVVGLMITIEDVTERLDRERSVASILDPADGERRTEALASEDWQVRGQAVRHLKQSASVEELRHLFDTLHRDHHDLNVLNSALRVLIAAGRTVVEPLVQMLSDQAANLRMHAALALGELRAQEATPDLVTTLNDPDENVRFHAIEALGRIGAAESIGPLSKIAASDNFFLAFAAIDALSKTEDARVAPLMVTLLDQELLRPAAIATLAVIGDEDCVPALARALNEGSGEPGAIADALSRIHRRYEETLGAGDFIREAAKDAIASTGRDRLVAVANRADVHRYAAATVLSWLGRDALDPMLPLLADEQLLSAIGEGVVAIGAAAVEPLIEQLVSASRTTRIAAADLLGRLGDRRAMGPLILALEDAEADVAAAAASALGAIGDPSALDGLVGMFGHPSATVRRAVIASVNAIGAPGTAARVRGAITDVDPRVRESAIRVAGYFGFDDLVPAIVAALADAVEDVRRAAIEQLPVLDGVDPAGQLAAAVSDETPRNRAAAAHALRLIDDPRAGVALRDALQDDDAWVRYFAATSLGQIHSGNIHAAALATLARQDSATHVRIAAISALGGMHQTLAATVAAELIDDHDDDLAIAAIKVLGTSARPEAHGLLERAARSARPARQLAAVRAFAGRPMLESVGVLAWAARLTDSHALSDEAIDALRRIAAADQPLAQRAAVAALRELAAEGTRRLEVIAAIARLPEFTVPEVASGLSAVRVGVRVATADALAAMRHPRASSELARALRDEEPSVRAAAVAGFARLGTPAVGRTIAVMRQNDPDEGVRRRADLACQRHGWGGGPLPRT
jgi:HEAT repeat protein